MHALTRTPYIVSNIRNNKSVIYSKVPGRWKNRHTLIYRSFATTARTESKKNLRNYERHLTDNEVFQVGTNLQLKIECLH